MSFNSLNGGGGVSLDKAYLVSRTKLYCKRKFETRMNAVRELTALTRRSHLNLIPSTA